MSVGIVSPFPRLGSLATYINEDHHGGDLLHDIKDCKFRMIFLSVEMAATSKLKDIMMTPKFSRRLGGLIVDEAHTVRDGGT